MHKHASYVDKLIYCGVIRRFCLVCKCKESTIGYSGAT
jgi:hypothetical protein